MNMSTPPDVPPTPPGSPPQGDAARGQPHDPLRDPDVQEWERHYSLAMHLTLLAIHFAIPLVPVIVLYLIKKDESPFIRDHGREAINFQISLLIYAIIGGILVPFCGIGFIVLTAVYVLGIVGMILAALEANKGRFYRYPACIRFL
jgi:uncharacterized Tic20 family protein